VSETKPAKILPSTYRGQTLSPLGERAGERGRSPRTPIRAVLGLSIAITLSPAQASPEATVFQAFLHCDAQFFTTLAKHAAQVPALRPLKRNAAGTTHLAVPNRQDEEGQTLALKPPLTVNGVAFDEFLDEVTELKARQETVYYWGFTTPQPVAIVLPVVQKLLPKAAQLTADGDTWARIDVFESGAWRNIANHAALKGQPATRPERALIVQANEDSGTRVICGLQAAPLPAAQLKRLRPDL
jgi:hypothetical protein